MSSQLLSRVGTPLVPSARKRNRSEPSVYGMIDLEESRKSKVARKRLYSGNSGEKSTESAELDASYVTVCDSQTESAGGIEDSEDSGTKCDNEVSTTIVEKLMANLEANINKQFNAINDRMDNLESRLEKKITQKVTQTLDKRVSSEMSKIKKSVDEHMNNVKADIAAEFRADFEDVSNKLDQISERTTGANNCVNLALNIVIRNLPEHNNENTMDKVNKLIKDGLKVADVECYQALRKGHNTNTHRVIVSSFRSSEDKRKVMVDKKNLKNSDMYKTVYIHHDQSVTERVMSENFRTVLQALKQHGLVMRGQHVVQQDRREGQSGFRQRQGQRQGSRNDHPYDRQHSHGNGNRASDLQPHVSSVSGGPNRGPQPREFVPRGPNRGSAHAQSRAGVHGDSYAGSPSDHQSRDSVPRDSHRGSPNAQARVSVPGDSRRGSPNQPYERVPRDSHRGRSESEDNELNNDWQ